MRIDIESEMQLHAITSVLAERVRQDARWGKGSHESEWWFAILCEEVGELATAILRQHFLGEKYEHRETQGMRAEAIQVAAVALAFVEFLDRQHLMSGQGG